MKRTPSICSASLYIKTFIKKQDYFLKLVKYNTLIKYLRQNKISTDTENHQ